MRIGLLFVVLGMAFAPAIVADEGSTDVIVHPVLTRYLEAAAKQQDYLRDATMEMEIDAQVPRLHKSGRAWGLRFVSRLGDITIKRFRFSGDDSVKKEIIARFLQAEHQVPTGQHSVRITPDNYRFAYKGLRQRNGQDVHILTVAPRRKELGLFKGELWLDRESFQPIRESGRWVRTPSVLVKNLDFVREYTLQDGIAIPTHVASVIDTRLAGRAELDIHYTNFVRGEVTVEAAENE